MEKKPWYKRKKVWKWIGIVFVGMIIFGNILEITGYNDKVEAEKAEELAAVQAKKAEEKAKKDAELDTIIAKEKEAEAEKKRVAEEKKVAEKERLANRTIDEKIKDAVTSAMSDKSYRSHKFEEGTLWIEVNAVAGWSENSSLKGTYMDALKLAEIIREDSLLDGANDVDITFFTPLTDQYGNTEDGRIVEIGFTSATLAKINFKNVLHKNVPTMADYYWEHPLFKANK